MTRSGGGTGRDLERYLLGRMSPSEQKGIETLLFEDDAVGRAVEDAEDHLIDRYLSGELDPEDRKAFEDHFAVSQLRQDRIAFRRVLPRAIEGRAREARDGYPPSSPARIAPSPGIASADGRPPRGWTRSGAAPAWVALAAVLVVGALLAQRRVTQLPAGSGQPPTPGAGVESPPGSSHGRPETTPLPPPSGLALPDQPLLVLRSGLLRSGGSIPRLTLPSGALVRIDAELDAPSPATEYSVVLRTAEGKDVAKSSGHRRPGASRVTVVLPADVLRQGDYILSIAEPGRPPDEISEYPFTVVR